MPERFECTTLAKKTLYINTLPFLFPFPTPHPLVAFGVSILGAFGVSTSAGPLFETSRRRWKLAGA